MPEFAVQLRYYIPVSGEARRKRKNLFIFVDMRAPAFDEFLNLFKEQFLPENREKISGGTAFRHLREWSSLQTLIVVTAVDEAYGVILAEEDFRLSVTVSDLYNRLIAKS